MIALTVGAACGDDGDDTGGIGDADVTRDAPATRIASPPARTTPAGTATTASGTPAAAVAEVRGIVGSVNAATNLISITRLSGADVDEIVVVTSTEIRDPDGGTVALRDIRPSDRIVARGEEDRGRLIASEITVEEAVPGAEPGG
jgi:hypothetical protein